MSFAFGILFGRSKRPRFSQIVMISLFVGATILSGLGERSFAEGHVNFLIFMADDAGVENYGCYGNAEAKTPHIDSLARGGVQFQTSWATPICNPTRAMILTGRYAHWTGNYHNSLHISDPEVGINFLKNNLTFAQVLGDCGYATALSGKWQLDGDPNDPSAGFDEYCIWEPNPEALPKGVEYTGLKENETTLSRYWGATLRRNDELIVLKPDGFGPDFCNDFLIDFIRRHRDEPFLAYYPMILPHGSRQGWTTTPDWGERGKLSGASMQIGTDYTDVLVGRLIEVLDELGLRENTIVMYCSDNGGRGNKGQPTEAGARVPMVIQGPGIENRGKVAELMSVADLLPTLAGLAGCPLPKGYEHDGMNLAPYLRGETDEGRPFLYSYVGSSRMVRDKDWLLEMVDPVYEMPDGRLYHCPSTHEKECEEMTDRSAPEARAAQNRLQRVLESIPDLPYGNPALMPQLRSYDEYAFPPRLVREYHEKRGTPPMLRED